MQVIFKVNNINFPKFKRESLNMKFQQTVGNPKHRQNTKNISWFRQFSGIILLSRQCITPATGKRFLSKKQHVLFDFNMFYSVLSVEISFFPNSIPSYHSFHYVLILFKAYYKPFTHNLLPSSKYVAIFYNISLILDKYFQFKPSNYCSV